MDPLAPGGHDGLGGGGQDAVAGIHNKNTKTKTNTNVMTNDKTKKERNFMGNFAIRGRPYIT